MTAWVRRIDAILPELEEEAAAAARLEKSNHEALFAEDVAAAEKRAEKAREMEEKAKAGQQAAAEKIAR